THRLGCKTIIRLLPKSLLRAGRALSFLAAGTPVRGPVRIALPARPNRLAAARARPAGPPVDGAALAPVVERGTHQPGGLQQHAVELIIARLSERQPRRQARVPEGLRAPEIADPGHDALVQ